MCVHCLHKIQTCADENTFFYHACFLLCLSLHMEHAFINEIMCINYSLFYLIINLKFCTFVYVCVFSVSVSVVHTQMVAAMHRDEELSHTETERLK